MSEAPLMIGVSGLRGITGRSLTPEVASRFAAAFGAWLVQRDAAAEPVVVIGRDGRAGGVEIHEAAIAGLRGAGCHVHDIGVAMTPTIAVTCDARNALGAIIVTASHNPQQWNGLKCLVRDGSVGADAHAPYEHDARAIVDRFNEGALSGRAEGPRGDLSRAADAHESHVAAVSTAVERIAIVHGKTPRSRPEKPVGQGLTVVLDSVNASGSRGGAAILAALGCEKVVHINSDDSGIFPHEPEPLRENLTGLCRAVREHGADVGFAQDPDADRLAIVDERGAYIGEEYTFVLAAMALLGTNNGAGGQPVLCTNLSTSRMIEDIAQRSGGRVVRTPVGEANVVEAMKRERDAGKNVILGGEGNGGVIWPSVTFVRDSLSAMALTLALMARTGKTISELVSDIPAYAIEKRKMPLASSGDAHRAVNAVEAHWSGARVDLQDGVRVDLEDSWVHVRASNTEPILRLIAEAPTPAAAAALLDDARRIIAKA